MANAVNHPPEAPRATDLEAWFNRLLARYQNVAPQGSRLDNLTDLSDPCQVYGLALSENQFRIVAVAVTHFPDRRNAEVKIFSFAGLTELASFAEQSLEEEFVLRDWRHEYPEIHDVLGDPVRTVGDALATALSNAHRSYGQMTPDSGIFVSQQSILQYIPAGAMWVMTVKGRLPSATKFLGPTRLNKDEASRLDAPSDNVNTPTAPPPTSQAFAAYNEPIVWFGSPPFPSVGDLVLNRVRIHREELVLKGELDGLNTYVYKSGLVAVKTEDRVRARNLINQYFAVLSRSGLASFSVPDSELIEVSDLDSESGELRGSKTILTPRNRLGRPILNPADFVDDFSFSTDERVAGLVFNAANLVASDPRLAELSLRFYDATTLLQRHYFTEAFVVGWSVIESYLQELFVQTLRSSGISKKRTDDSSKDWTASQRIDVVLVASQLSKKDADDLHSLRKKRNDIVHKLATATGEDAADCLNKAQELLQLAFVPNVAFRRARI